MKDRLIECFRDTMNQINSNNLLLVNTRKAMKSTRVCYPSYELRSDRENNEDALLSVIEDTTFHAAYPLTRKYRNVAVLNFASPVKAGGGVAIGAMSQEECLCRSSNLLPCIKSKAVELEFYTYHKMQNDNMFSDRLIYSENITVFKNDDEIPQNMPECEWFNVDVITCAAPDLRGRVNVNDSVLKDVLANKIRAILSAAINNDVDAIVLGAFGCGVFQNPPDVVAATFKKVIRQENYQRYFKEIVFAIKHSDTDNSNFIAFKKAFSEDDYKEEIIQKPVVNANNVKELCLSYGDFPVRNVDLNGRMVKYYNRINSRDGGKAYPDGFFDEKELVLSDEQMSTLDGVLGQLDYQPYVPFDMTQLGCGAPTPDSKYVSLVDGTELEIEDAKPLIEFFNSICDFAEYYDLQEHSDKSQESVICTKKEIKYCKKCGSETLKNSKFCIKCGTKILIEEGATTLVCSECHSSIEIGSKYCSYCGKEVRLHEDDGEGTTVLKEEEIPNTYIDIRYKLIKEIGKGGTARVYLADDEKIGRQCAVKIVSKTGYANKIASQMLLEEANKMKFLHHISIPQLYDILDEESRLCIVMEYIEGSTLEKIIKNTRYPLSENLVVDWAKQLCRVLDYLHNLNPPRIFRDVKPSNIMLQPNGEIKLFDFGIMRVYDSNKDTDTCNLGTRGFAAPEQFSTRGQSDARTDIYALGITIHYLLTGINPVKMEDEIIPISTYRPELPKALDDIIRKCTKQNPDDRYQTCKEVLRDLENYNKKEI